MRCSGGRGSRRTGCGGRAAPGSSPTGSACRRPGRTRRRRRMSPSAPGASAGTTISCSTTTSASANTRSVAAASPASQSKMRLSRRPGWSSRMTGASSSERALRVDDDRQRLVLDVDQLERVPGRVAVVGDHERHLLALEADLVGGQHRLGVRRQRRHPGAAAGLQIGAGEHGVDARVRQRRRGVDRDDPGVGERAAQDARRAASRAAGRRRRYRPWPRMRRSSSLRASRPKPNGRACRCRPSPAGQPNHRLRRPPPQPACTETSAAMLTVRAPTAADPHAPGHVLRGPYRPPARCRMTTQT